jgi:SAM-dependent methyltransferase
VTTTVNHYAAQFWNDLPAVDQYLQRRSTGGASHWWMQYFKDRYAMPARRHALIIGCGNGWVERFLADLGVAEHFDAFDASADYLKAAEEQRGDRPITYRQFDWNTWVPERSYDLIVNVAALHHCRYLFRMTHLLSGALEPRGVFVHWEYVGPSRNQYTAAHLALMHGINESLPERFRTRERLSHTVAEHIAGDPTEAVHSADILRALDDFFEPVECKMLGGGVAYHLLWNNIDEFRKDDDEAKTALDWLIRLDESLTEHGVVPPLFAFMVYGSRMRKASLGAVYDRLVRERLREKFADVARGYYPGEFLKENRWTKHFFRR